MNGIVVGKPKDEQFYEEYKEVYLKVLHGFHCETLPILYNVNIGHAVPIGILPLGIEYELIRSKRQSGFEIFLMTAGLDTYATQRFQSVLLDIGVISSIP